MVLLAYEPVTVVQEFFFDTLRVDSTVLGLLGNPPAIRPAFAPDLRPDLYLTPRIEAAISPMHSIAGFEMMRWRIIGWKRGYSQLGLRDVMRAVMGSLTGMERNGKRFPAFVDSDGIGWAIHVKYGGPAATVPEPGETEVWQMLASFYDVALRQKE